MAQDAPKADPIGPKSSQDSPKTAPTWRMMRLLPPKQVSKNNDKTIVVFNKIDLVAEQADLNSEITISAKTGQGLQNFKDQLKKRLGLSLKVGSGFSARARHISSLLKGKEALIKAQSLLVTHREGELVAEELRICQQNLSEITGEFSADDLLGEIFSSFCIGK